ncbi:type III secretion system effector BopA family protein [Castellaniella sp. WN]
MIELNEFSRLANLGHRIEVRDNKGMPTPQAAQVNFKGRILLALSHVPFLRKLQVVNEYVNKYRQANAQALGLFLSALSQKFGAEAADVALTRNKVDLTGATPLQKRIVERLINTAQDQFNTTGHAQGAAAPHICGFKNLGNTCYANSALKFLICSIGQKHLIDHLDNFSKTTTNRNERDAAEKLVNVINASFSTNSPLEEELHALFSSLQELDIFQTREENGQLLFKIIGMQNDAQEFLAKLTDVFGFSEIDGCAMTCQQSLLNGETRRRSPSELSYCHDTTVSNPDLTLQGIVDQTHQPEKVQLRWNEGDQENTEVTQIKQWSVPDLSELHRFNLHINALNVGSSSYVPIRVHLNAKFTDDVKLKVLDEQTGDEWMVTFEPREVIIQTGDAISGHYYMYSKQDANNWLRHNDTMVHSCSSPRSGDQAKLIGFAVKQKVRLKPDEDTRLMNAP